MVRVLCCSVEKQLALKIFYWYVPDFSLGSEAGTLPMAAEVRVGSRSERHVLI